jgi:hypothetical protein
MLKLMQQVAQTSLLSEALKQFDVLLRGSLYFHPGFYHIAERRPEKTRLTHAGSLAHIGYHQGLIASEV